MPAARPIEIRFWEKVAKGDPLVCWDWTASTVSRGEYGQIHLDGGTKRAHVYSWELANGRRVRPGYFVDHLCGRPICVNPAHLREATPRENTLRGQSWSAHKARQTHCIHGHEFTPENTYYRPDRYGRMCIACRDFRAKMRRLQGKTR